MASTASKSTSRRVELPRIDAAFARVASTSASPFPVPRPPSSSAAMQMSITRPPSPLESDGADVLSGDSESDEMDDACSVLSDDRTAPRRRRLRTLAPDRGPRLSARSDPTSSSPAFAFPRRPTATADELSSCRGAEAAPAHSLSRPRSCPDVSLAGPEAAPARPPVASCSADCAQPPTAEPDAGRTHMNIHILIPRRSASGLKYEYSYV
eukprot:tig00021522_g22115.t1